VRRRAPSTALALALALAAPPAHGHSFPPLRTVVVQVERCEVALLVGYRAGTGEATRQLAARAAAAPRGRAAEAVRDAMATEAMTPLAVTVDGVPLVPSSARAKLSTEGDGARPMVVVLVTYPLPPGKALTIASRDPRITRISWTDRDSARVAPADAPAQGRWFSGLAAFSLALTPPPGGPACAAAPRPSPRS